MEEWTEFDEEAAKTMHACSVPVTRKAAAATARQMERPGSPRDEGVHADRDDSAHPDEPEGGTADEDGYGEVLGDGREDVTNISEDVQTLTTKVPKLPFAKRWRTIRRG